MGYVKQTIHINSVSILYVHKYINKYSTYHDDNMDVTGFSICPSIVSINDILLTEFSNGRHFLRFLLFLLGQGHLERTSYLYHPLMTPFPTAFRHLKSNCILCIVLPMT